MSEFDVIVVGAGQAGLGIGYLLQQSETRFTILERGEIGESWRSQRWESFAVNTPNWMNGLPGSPYDGIAPDGFHLRDQLVASFERHAERHSLPIRRGVTVERVEASEGSPGFEVHSVDAQGRQRVLLTRSVVVATGLMQSPKIPAIAGTFPSSVVQLHASEYRAPGLLPDGAVIVVGSGQSGCQIADDLATSGRAVYLCTSKVARVPRRYRGRDALEWMTDLGKWAETVSDLPDPRMEFAAQPQVSGVGRLGKTLSLQALQQQDIRLMGRLQSVSDGRVHTDDGLAAHIAFADAFSADFKRTIDTHIDSHSLDYPAADVDPADAPAGPEVPAAGMMALDLEEADVGTVIWCTGFTTSFDWLRAPVIDEHGRPIHRRGVSPVPGIYFLGFPWLHTRKSGIIYGIEEDARHVEEAIAAHLSRPWVAPAL